MIDGIVMKGKRIIIPFQFERHILQQLHNNHIGIEKIRPPNVRISILVEHE